MLHPTRTCLQLALSELLVNLFLPSAWKIRMIRTAKLFVICKKHLMDLIQMMFLTVLESRLRMEVVEVLVSILAVVMKLLRTTASNLLLVSWIHSVSL
jgi:hypothetical protein